MYLPLGTTNTVHQGKAIIVLSCVVFQLRAKLVIAALVVVATAMVASGRTFHGSWRNDHPGALASRDELVHWVSWVANHKKFEDRLKLGAIAQLGDVSKGAACSKMATAKLGWVGEIVWAIAPNFGRCSKLLVVCHPGG